MNPRTTASGLRRRHSSPRRRPSAGVRTGTYLGAAAAGVVLVAALVAGDPGAQAEAVNSGAVTSEVGSPEPGTPEPGTPEPGTPEPGRSEASSVARLLGVDAATGEVAGGGELELLEELAASRSSREDAEAAARFAQAAADQAVLDQQRADADAAARRAAEDAAAMREAAAAFAAAEEAAAMREAAAAFAAAEEAAAMREAAAAFAAAEEAAALREAAAAFAAAEEEAALREAAVASAAAKPAAPPVVARPAAPPVAAPPVAAPPAAGPPAAAPPLAAFRAAAQGVARITNTAGPVRPQVQAAADAVVGNVPGAGAIRLGGTRASAADPGGHPSGLALDYMVMSDRALGEAITAYHLAHWDELGVAYVIWEQRILSSPGGAWKQMENRGSVTADHFDHVHVNYR